MPAHAAGQGACALSKWQLLNVIEELREPLGLKGTSIAVLRALLSFIPSDEISERRLEAHLCFASNASLARRAHVSIQTIERHIAKLVSLDLLQRLPSGNGKRWARRDNTGRITYATGLSALPLLRRYAELCAQAEQYAAEKQKLITLRDRCASGLAELVSLARDSATVAALTSRARKLLRRKPQAEALQGFLSEITTELAAYQDENPTDLRASDTQSEGHKETSLNRSAFKHTNMDVQVTDKDMETKFPKLCAELRLARTPQACQQRMDQLADQLGLGYLWTEAKKMGPALSFIILGYLLERLDQIHAPRSYAWRLITSLNRGEMSWQNLMRAPESARNSHSVRGRGQGAKKGIPTLQRTLN
ncbi:helix-turn-helix domain-containing protein [Cognatishimia sp. SS12]|uniref:helix-turn-helix domain-containing protein n=1 Tax=Cognatishimia sp. SS12 TaxID=2979465 RepID=UPI00232B9D00|nr:helix-turn-helix domain-containing protein [Cognatishimia sp. SS12]MDC0739617.1 helix-turn-helix domain-containing protein [Cognatishimia sp. SS12]